LKHISHFQAFLADTVNLNRTRIDLLESSVSTIQSFIRNSDWEPKVRRFEQQGSWAHGTIIRPVKGREFDSDLLVVVDPVSGWSAADYIKELGKIFLGSDLYRAKTRVWDYCITITYSGDRKIDISPCVFERISSDTYEVCNKVDNKFEITNPVEYTRWVNKQNRLSGQNSIKKCTRLLKYLRDIKGTFSCPSIVMTTIIGKQIEWYEKDSPDFADVPTTFRTILIRLDAWLDKNPNLPRIENPVLKSENFADNIDQTKYQNFCKFIKKYKEWTVEAFDEKDRDKSIGAWRKILGSEFAKSVVLENSAQATGEVRRLVRSLLDSAGAHSSDLVEHVREWGTWILPPEFGRPPYMQPPPWPEAQRVTDSVYVSASWHKTREGPGRVVASGEAVLAHGGLWFDVRVNQGDTVPGDYRVEWRITNTGAAALVQQNGRGGFYLPTISTRRWEPLKYRGVHISEAFIVDRRTEQLVGVSDQFFVVIE